jgi:non-heme chloroperoxidase
MKRNLLLLTAVILFTTSTKAQLTEKFIGLSNRIKLQYVEQGDPNGTAVIFLHGYTDSWHSFEKVLPLLPANMHAFAISQRGHGLSSKPVGNYRPQDFAEDIATFIKDRKLGKAVIVGHSMGGIVAQQFAMNYPELTQAIVIISSDASFKDNPGLPEFGQEILKLSDPVSYQFADDFQKATCANPIDSAYYRVLVAESMKVPAHVWKAAMSGFMAVDFSQALNDVKQPALILWGDKDVFVSRADQDILVKNIKTSKLLVYEGTGHALHWEQPQRFVGDLLSFVNKIN